MYDVGDAADSYAICEKGIAFISENLQTKRPDFQATSHVYYSPLDSFTAAITEQPCRIATGPDDYVGFHSNIRFSPDGSMVAFIEQPLSNEADRRIFMAHLTTLSAFDVHELILETPVSLPINSFEFGSTSESLFITNENCARVTLSHLTLKHNEKPTTLVQHGAVVAFHPLQHGSFDRLLVTSTSIVDSSLWQIIDTTRSTPPKVVSSATKHGSKYGLSHRMLSEFWYEGADDSCVHCVVIRPSNFDETKTYPWILMPHGGPVSAWTDAWSTRVSA
jgi:hypothetical protein